MYFAFENRLPRGSNAPSYFQIHKGLVQRSGGFFPAFYRGFYPWGLAQCTKGIPVLFVQHESFRHMETLGLSHTTAANLSGCLGGIAQAIFVTPFQKLKVSVVASGDVHTLPPAQAFLSVVRQEGVSSLFNGLLPTMIRGSIDWGIRFGMALHVKQFILQRKKEKSGGDDSLNVLEWIYCGLIGGAASALTR
jgi:hypothetical protein